MPCSKLWGEADNSVRGKFGILVEWCCLAASKAKCSTSQLFSSFPPLGSAPSGRFYNAWAFLFLYCTDRRLAWRCASALRFTMQNSDITTHLSRFSVLVHRFQLVEFCCPRLPQLPFTRRSAWLPYTPVATFGCCPSCSASWMR